MLPPQPTLSPSIGSGSLLCLYNSTSRFVELPEETGLEQHSLSTNGQVAGAVAQSVLLEGTRNEMLEAGGAPLKRFSGGHKFLMCNGFLLINTSD